MKRAVALAVSALVLAGCSSTYSASSDPKPHGKIVYRTIPGRLSGFHARRAAIYLPPTASGHARFPVIELLHGTEGGPSDWLRRGEVDKIVNRFAREHHGNAPIVVMPDINGSKAGDSECITTKGANVEQYLVDDVPKFLRAHYPVARGRRNWTVAGLSEGGTCSIMLSLRYPKVFGNFGDLSGLARPTVGEHDNRKRTIRELFGGSVYAYDHHDPTWLLRRHKYPRLAGWFETGDKDTETVNAQARLVSLSAAADINVRARTTPGSHGWPVWRTSLRQMLPWIWSRATN